MELFLEYALDLSVDEFATLSLLTLISNSSLETWNFLEIRHIKMQPLGISGNFTGGVVPKPKYTISTTHWTLLKSHFELKRALPNLGRDFLRTNARL